jgi:hypothetical protein
MYHYSIREFLPNSAMEVISYAPTIMGVLARDGIALATEKHVTRKLLHLFIAKGGYGGSGKKIFLLNKYQVLFFPPCLIYLEPLMRPFLCPVML